MLPKKYCTSFVQGNFRLNLICNNCKIGDFDLKFNIIDL